MLYELRVYHCVPGRLPDLLKRFDTITLGIWERHGIQQAGFWTTAIGESSQALYYFLKWESLADREKKWNAFQADPAILDDNTNGFLHPQRIFLQSWVSVNGLKQLQAKPVVHGRRRKHFDLIVDFLDAFNMLHGIFRIRLERGPRNLAQQRDGRAVHFIRNIVEYSEPGKHQQFVTNFLGDTLLATGGWLITLCGLVLGNTQGCEYKQTDG